MEEQLTTYETAMLAKEKGFDENVFKNSFCYDKNGNWKNTIDVIKEERIFAPTQALLQKWLREKHDIYVTVDVDITLSWVYRIGSLHPQASYIGAYIQSEYVFSVFEEALDEGLIEALKLVP